MQVENKRACSSCGAENTPDADFCWQCLVPFAGAVAQQVGRTNAAALPPAPAPATTRRSAPKRILAIVAGLIGAWLVFGVVRAVLAPDYHVPDALPGMARIHDASAQKFEDQMRTEGAKNQVDMEAAVYGPGAPQVFLVLANGQAVEDTDQLFREFLGGIESSGATVRREAVVHGSYQGAEWRCVPVSARTLSASVCMWREDASVGMTLDLEPGDDPSGALLDAYDASHA